MKHPTQYTFLGGMNEMHLYLLHTHEKKDKTLHSIVMFIKL